MSEDSWTEPLLGALTGLVTAGGVCVLAAAFESRGQATSLSVLCATVGVVLGAMVLVTVELWATLRDLIQSARLSARRAEEQRHAVQLVRQRRLNAIAFQFGYAFAKGLPTEQAWDAALERCFTGPVLDWSDVEMAA